jgi:hypothetical protein
MCFLWPLVIFYCCFFFWKIKIWTSLMFEAKCNIVCVILNLESAHHAKDLMKDKEEQQYFFLIQKGSSLV